MMVEHHRRGPSALLITILAARVILSGSAIGAAEAPATTPNPALQNERALQRGFDWLLKQQAADGGWHSTTYGQMRCGVGNTALAIYSLSLGPEKFRTSAEPEINRGIEFLLSNLHERGFIRAPDNDSDYPTYATALLLTVLDRMHVDRWQSERKRMRAYLVQIQFPTVDKNSDSGGWAPVGGDPTGPVPSEHANISATRFALAALMQTGEIESRNREPALTFLARCQNLNAPPRDGGFFFTPVPDDPLNKAGVNSRTKNTETARSYGSATADGLLALVACGLAPNDPRITAALDWLDTNAAPDEVPGFDTDAVETPSAKNALKFYYHAALATAMHEFPHADFARQRQQLAASIVATQNADGSWANPSALMHEDDPLIATSLAIQSLSMCSDQ